MTYSYESIPSLSPKELRDAITYGRNNAMTYTFESILSLSPKELRDAITYARNNAMTYTYESIPSLSPKELKDAITYGRTDAMTYSSVLIISLLEGPDLTRKRVFFCSYDRHNRFPRPKIFFFAGQKIRDDSS